MDDEWSDFDDLFTKAATDALAEAREHGCRCETAAVIAVACTAGHLHGVHIMHDNDCEIVRAQVEVAARITAAPFN